MSRWPVLRGGGGGLHILNRDRPIENQWNSGDSDKHSRIHGQFVEKFIPVMCVLGRIENPWNSWVLGGLEDTRRIRGRVHAGLVWAQGRMKAFSWN